MRRLHDAVHRNGQEMSVCLVLKSLHTRVLGHNCEADVRQIHFQEVREPQYSQNTAQCEFFLIPAQRTL